MAGLLDVLFGGGASPEQSQQLMGLAAGLLSANGSQGLGAGILGMNNAQDAMLKRQDIMQQIKLRDLQAQQQQRQFDLQTPFLEEAARRMRAASQGGGAPAAQASIPAGAISSPGAFVSPPAGGVGPVAPLSEAPTALTQPPAAQSGQAPMFQGVPDNVAFSMIGTGGFADIPKTISEYNKPTDLAKLMQQGGIDPNSAIGREMTLRNIAKQNYIAPINARPGMIGRDPITNQPLFFNPHVPDGFSPSFDASGNVTGLRQIEGALPAIAGVQTAKTMGVAEATPTTAYDASGKPIFSTKATDVRRATGQPAPAAQPGVSGAFNLSDPALIAGINDIKDPQERANAFAALQAQLVGGGNKPATPAAPAGSVTPVPQLGAPEGAKLSQDELSKKGLALLTDNGQTNTVISRLQNIKMLAPGAITGAESSRRDFFNGLLSLAGIKGAEDAKTASDLVDKNQAQIVSALRMGQGGAGTDALQTLLGAANPNRHMTNEAVQEAADQLIASQKMIQAKAQLLQPHYLGRDPVAYGTKELQFDQNADPRVWQLQNMTKPQQDAYVKTLPAGVAADMLKKLQSLKQLGVFQ